MATIHDALVAYRMACRALTEAVQYAVPVGTTVTHPAWGPCVVCSEVTDPDHVAVRGRLDMIHAVPVITMLDLMRAAARKRYE